MTYQEIEKANSEIKTLPLRGKQYAEVSERIKAFRKLYPEGALISELVYNEDGVYIVKASVYNEDGKLLATDYAEEVRGSTNINRTSPLENCSTSAKGRALGSLGLTGGSSIASYEEVSNAQLREEGAKLATKKEKEGFVKTCEALGLDYHEILIKVGFDRNKQPEGMTVEQYGKAMEICTNKQKERG